MWKPFAEFLIRSQWGAHSIANGVLIQRKWAAHSGEMGGSFSALGERIPTLASYLDEAKRHKQMKIILEIKDQKSDSANAYIAAKAVRMVRERRMETQVEYISFSPYVCDRVLAEDSTAYVTYVGGKMTPKEAHGRGYRCIDYSLTIFLKHPEWVRQAHALGLQVNIWTPDTEEEKRMARILHPDFITTDEPVE